MIKGRKPKDLSVIIPVYNAAPFINQAVISALAQEETGEVILIEDASSDNSLEICASLAEKYKEVRLLKHPDGKNHGPGESRNLGISNASFDYVAFLDVDDFYLPNRFELAIQILESEPNVDGVYEAIGTYFESESINELWKRNGGKNAITTVKRKVPPEQLFENLAPIGKDGYFHLNGLVIKRCVFKKSGLFNRELRLHQDTEMVLRLAAVSNLVGGQLDEPVAMRRIHPTNRIRSPRSNQKMYCDRLQMWRSLWLWAKENLYGERREIVFIRYIEFASRPISKSRVSLINKVRSIGQLLVLVMRYPRLVFEITAWGRFLRENAYLIVREREKPA